VQKNGYAGVIANTFGELRTSGLARLRFKALVENFLGSEFFTAISQIHVDKLTHVIIRNKFHGWAFICCGLFEP